MTTPSVTTPVQIKLLAKSVCKYLLFDSGKKISKVGKLHKMGGEKREGL